MYFLRAIHLTGEGTRICSVPLLATDGSRRALCTPHSSAKVNAGSDFSDVDDFATRERVRQQWHAKITVLCSRHDPHQFSYYRH